MKKIELVVCTRRTALLGIAGAVAELVGCGGGGVAGLSSGGTGSFTSGTITGLGSIIVNGIRYNDDTASVLGSDDSKSSNLALQLGMRVNIEGSAVTPATTATGLPTATAYRISYDSEWIGPVSNINSINKTFEILGHTVDVLSTTIFDESIQQFSALIDTPDVHYVEVYGYLNRADGHIQASRVEVSTTKPSAYKLSGAITLIDTTNKTANLGLTPIAWGDPAVLPSTVSSGDFVRVVLNNTPAGSVWTASRIQPLSSPLSGLSSDDDYEAEIYGSITAFQSNASFEVNGIPVDASAAKITGTLNVGVQVEVEGSILSGKLIATEVSVKTDSQIGAQEFEFYGLISGVTALNFVVHDVTFVYDTNTLNYSLITNNSYVKVKALRTAIGTWQAIEIERAG